MVAMLAVAGTVVARSTASTNSKNRAILANDEMSLIMLRVPPFRTVMTKYPGRLSQLTAPIIRDASCTAPGYCDVDSCNATFATTEVVKWNDNSNNWGPFLTHRLIVKDHGYPLYGGFGFVQDPIFRVGNVSGAAVHVNIIDVEEPDARELDFIRDASDGAGAGRVQWGAATNGRVTVRFTLALASAWAGC